jgi:hypothetical protein
MHDWMNWLGNTLPILILLAFWIFFVWGMKKPGGSWGWGGWVKVHQRQNELLEQEIELLRQTNELLKKLVASRS